MGHQPHRGGGIDSPRWLCFKHFVVYVEMKESGPLGGYGYAPGTPPRDLPMHVEFFTSDYLFSVMTVFSAI